MRQVSCSSPYILHYVVCILSFKFLFKIQQSAASLLWQHKPQATVPQDFFYYSEIPQGACRHHGCRILEIHRLGLPGKPRHGSSVNKAFSSRLGHTTDFEQRIRYRNEVFNCYGSDYRYLHL